MKQIYRMCLTGIMGVFLCVPQAEAAYSAKTSFGTFKPTVTTKSGQEVRTVSNRSVELRRAIGNSSRQGAIRSFGRTENVILRSGWKAPEKDYTVTLAFPAEDKGCFVQAVGFTAEDGSQYWAMQEEEFGPIFAEMPAGKYVVTGFFAVCDPEPDEYGQYSQKSSALVVYENVEVSDDMDLIVDGAEATNFITATPVASDGEEYTLSVVKIVANEDGEPDFGEEIPGNAIFIGQRMGLQHKTLGELFWSQIGMGSQWYSEDFPEYSEPSLAEIGGIYVNDFSDDIMVIASFDIQPVEGVPTLTLAMQEGCAPAVLKADPSDYTFVENRCEQSEIGRIQPYPAIEDPWSVSATNYFDGKGYDAMSLDSNADLSIFGYCASPIARVDFASSTRAMYADYTSYYACDTIYYEDFMMVSEERTYTSSSCPEVYIKDGAQTILNKTNLSFYEMPSAPKNQLATVPEAFRYGISQQTLPYGITPGYISLPVLSDMSGSKAELIPFSPAYCGYGGDYVGGVNAVVRTSPKITYNGEPVDYDEEYYSDFWSGGFFGWCYDWNYENHPAGAYTMSFEGPMIIDELEGKVQFEVAFDQTKEDCVPPVVQYLMFRDKNANVTCIFDEASQGDMYICAGDFMADSKGVLSDYVEGGELKVSYAPFGTEEWTAFEIEKIADASECFAPIFKGSLDQVDKKGVKGWFDLRIEMTDAAGNSMSQMSSPAFCINSQSGVDALNPSARGIRIEGRTAISDCGGIEVFSVCGSKVAGFSSQRADLSDLPAGIYIIRSGNASIKTILK